MVQKFLNQLEIRFGRYRGIKNLTTIIVFGMGIVYLADYLLGPAFGIYPSNYLVFDKHAILRGQVWRMVTFIFTPPNASLLFILMQLLFIHFTGNLLQRHWGTLRFNIFYFFGAACSMAAGFITGYATSHYLNLSMLLAVSVLYPMMQVNFYGIIPIRMKWLAVIELLLILPGLLSGSWGVRIAILISLLNVALFFYDRLLKSFQDARRRYEWKKNWR